MQLLSFTAGGQTYAIETAAVVEVLPVVPIRPLPRLPEYVLGVVAYRGRMIPVIDLARRLTGEPARARLSTRLIVIETRSGPSTATSRLGIVVENLVSTVGAGDADTVFPEMHLESSPYLGKIVRVAGQTIHVLIPGNLLPPELASGLAAALPDPS